EEFAQIDHSFPSGLTVCPALVGVELWLEKLLDRFDQHRNAHSVVGQTIHENVDQSLRLPAEYVRIARAARPFTCGKNADQVIELVYNGGDAPDRIGRY